MTQLEMPWWIVLKGAKWVDQSIVDSWSSYREAVIWCWENRPKDNGKNEPHDQRMCAYYCSSYPSHFSRSIRRDSKSPMDLDYDCAGAFQAYTGWRGIDQYMAKRHRLTVLEEIQDKRAAA